MDDLISRLSELRCQYNCFDENERDAYHTLSEAIKALSDVPDTNVGDTISRQAAIKAFKNFLTIHDSRGVEYLCSAVTMDGVNKILSDLPSVERHGKWLDGYGFAGNYYDCFVCGQCKKRKYGKNKLLSALRSNNARRMMADLIDRQAAIDALKKISFSHWFECGEYLSEDTREIEIISSSKALETIEALPSAEPETIHCKDCKHSEHWYSDRRRCFLWSEDGISVFNDGFCNYAERREDE